MSTADEAITKESASTASMLGLERWVQFGFIGIALTLFWFLDHFLAALIDWIALKVNFASPEPMVITAASTIIALVTTYFLHRNDRVYGFAAGVAHEMANVTWPTRDETWSATVVVLVVSVISSIIIGVFDAVWSTITDLIY